MWIDDAHTVAQLTHGSQHCYLLVCPGTREALVIDPGVPDFLEQVRALDVKVSAVLNTHSHYDHTGGNQAFIDAFGAALLGFSGGDQLLEEGSEVRWGGQRGRVMHTPGHTPDSICLRADPFLFAGDTLFIASCGNAFGEAGMHAMYESLKRLDAMPAETIFCCGHDYVVSGLEYVLRIEPDNAAAKHKLAAVERAHQEGRAVVSTLAEERAYNPFWRLETEEMARFLGRAGGLVPTDRWQRFKLLRDLKNRR